MVPDESALVPALACVACGRLIPRTAVSYRGKGSVRDTGRNVELVSVGLRTIDRSTVQSGAPNYYAIDGGNLHLYPTPNNVFTLELRYWKLPADLVNDSDIPSIPAGYHDLLWYYA